MYNYIFCFLFSLSCGGRAISHGSFCANLTSSADPMQVQLWSRITQKDEKKKGVTSSKCIARGITTSNKTLLVAKHFVKERSEVEKEKRTR